MTDNPYEFEKTEAVHASNRQEHPEIRAASKRIEQNRSAEYYHRHYSGNHCFLIDGEWKQAVGHLPCPDAFEGAPITHSGSMKNPANQNRLHDLHKYIEMHFSGDYARFKEWMGEQGL